MENSKTHALRVQIAQLVDEYAAIALAPQQFLPGASVVPPSGKVIGAQELKNMVEASSGRLADHRPLQRRIREEAGSLHRRQAPDHRQLGFVGQPGGLQHPDFTQAGRARHQEG
jgi:hypothetical protein